MDCIETVDGNYLGFPQVAACYIIESNNEFALFDNVAKDSLQAITEAIDLRIRQGLSFKYIILSHIHLDHAGLTGKLAQLYPEAKVLVHPKGARHIADPSRLESSSRRVYGDEAFDHMYGSLLEVPSDQISSPADDSSIILGDMDLKFIYTRGHANHHFCVYIPQLRSILTGDSFGVAYPELNETPGSWIFPSTSPTDFHYEEALLSLEKILATGAEKVYLTHFGEWSNIEYGAKMLAKHLDHHESIRVQMTKEDLDSGALEGFEQQLTDYAHREMKNQGLSCSPKQKQLMAYDIKLNIQGLAIAASRSR